MPVVRVSDLSFSYDMDKVLHELSMEIPKGLFISLLGPNGSGKTTLLKNICHLLKPQDGHVEVLGKSLKQYNHKALAKTLAVVHQSYASDFNFSVEEVVLMGRYPYSKSFQSESQKDIDRVEEALKMTDTFHLKHKSIQSISGGERQRVMIARALAQETEILLLDEPISHLDIKYQIEILKLCRKLNKEHQITVIATLHDINLAARYSDHIILMKNGRIHSVGSPEHVITEMHIQSVYEIDVKLMTMDQYPHVIPY